MSDRDPRPELPQHRAPSAAGSSSASPARDAAQGSAQDPGLRKSAGANDRPPQEPAPQTAAPQREGERPALDPQALEPATAGKDRPQPPTGSRVDTGMASVAWQAAAGTIGPTRLAETGSSAPRPSHGAGEPDPAGPLTDAAIMLRVREGDETAFTYLIEKYHRAIVHFMFRMVHNQAVAEELAQEVFLRVYRSRESYRAEAKFTTWLYRIATNLGVNYARDHKNERAAQNIYLDQPDAETGTTPDVADSRPNIEQDLVRNERMRAIRQHVMALPERQRSAVLMHKYQELDYKQIGAVLKLSESATKSLLFRAYQTLREKLKEYV